MNNNNNNNNNNVNNNNNNNNNVNNYWNFSVNIVLSQEVSNVDDSLELLMNLYSALEFEAMYEWIRNNKFKVNVYGNSGNTLLHRIACKPISISSIYNPFKELINQHEKMFNESINVNQRLPHGLSFIHLAIKHQNMQVFDYLINHHQINLQLSNNELITPIHVASRYGSIHCLRVLIYAVQKHGKSFMDLDMYGQSALHYAVASKQDEALKILIGFGFDINLRDSLGMTPLLIACSVGNNFACINSLYKASDCDLGKIDVKNHAKDTMLHLLCSNGDVDTIISVSEIYPSLISEDKFKTPNMAGLTPIDILNSYIHIEKSKENPNEGYLNNLRKILNYAPKLDNNIDVGDDDNKCVICYDTVCRSPFLTCGHSFCRGCLYSYFTSAMICPLCKKSVKYVYGQQYNSALQTHLLNNKKDYKTRETEYLLDNHPERIIQWIGDFGSAFGKNFEIHEKIALNVTLDGIGVFINHMKNHKLLISCKILRIQKENNSFSGIYFQNICRLLHNIIRPIGMDMADCVGFNINGDVFISMIISSGNLRHYDPAKYITGLVDYVRYLRAFVQTYLHINNNEVKINEVIETFLKSAEILKPRSTIDGSKHLFREVKIALCSLYDINMHLEQYKTSGYKFYYSFKVDVSKIKIDKPNRCGILLDQCISQYMLSAPLIDKQNPVVGNQTYATIEVRFNGKNSRIVFSSPLFQYETIYNKDGLFNIMMNYSMFGLLTSGGFFEYRQYNKTVFLSINNQSKHIRKSDISEAKSNIKSYIENEFIQVYIFLLKIVDYFKRAPTRYNN